MPRFALISIIDAHKIDVDPLEMCLNFKHSWCLFWHLGWREREKNNTQTITITQKVEPFQMKIRFNQANCWAAFFRAFGPFHSGRGKNTLSTGDPMESSQATVAQGEINQFKGQPTTEHRTQCHLHRKLPETTNLFLWTAVEKTDLFSKGDFYWFASHCRLSHSFSIRFSRQKLLFM